MYTEGDQVKFRYQNSIEVCRFTRNTIFSTSIMTLACLNRMTIESIENNKSSFGALLETWVYSELLKMCTQQNESWNIYYYRDKDQVEVDFILENQAHEIIGIDVKASQTILNQDFRGLRKLACLADKNWISGIVLYNGDSLWAIPFPFID